MEWNKREVSLLVFFETCAVDYGGRVQGCRMNADDHAIAKRMVGEGLVTFNRLPFAYIESQSPTSRAAFTHFVTMSEEAWQVAHRFRRERANRAEKRAHDLLKPYASSS